MKGELQLEKCAVDAVAVPTFLRPSLDSCREWRKLPRKVLDQRWPTQVNSFEGSQSEGGGGGGGVGLSSVGLCCCLGRFHGREVSLRMSVLTSYISEQLSLPEKLLLVVGVGITWTS